MSSLAIVALALGSVVALTGVPCVFSPERARGWMAAFPRNAWLGWALTAVDLAWSAWLVMHMSLGPFDRYKPALYVVGPLLFFLVVFLMDELLAARALGGLLLLVPSPLLDVARWHESEFRLVVATLAYVFVVMGILLVLCPYLFRKATGAWMQNNTRCRLGGSLGLALGLFLIVLALTVY